MLQAGWQLRLYPSDRLAGPDPDEQQRTENGCSEADHDPASHHKAAFVDMR